MPSICIDLSPESAAWLEFLKNNSNEAAKANDFPGDNTVEDEARYLIELAYFQACAAGRVPAEIRDDDIPF